MQVVLVDPSLWLGKAHPKVSKSITEMPGGRRLVRAELTSRGGRERKKRLGWVREPNVRVGGGWFVPSDHGVRDAVILMDGTGRGSRSLEIAA